jgi:hypothetical protein
LGEAFPPGKDRAVGAHQGNVAPARRAWAMVHNGGGRVLFLWGK